MGHQLSFGSIHWENWTVCPKLLFLIVLLFLNVSNKIDTNIYHLTGTNSTDSTPVILMIEQLLGMNYLV